MNSSRAIDFLFREGIEGVKSMDPEDVGNWTGGKKGVGQLLGTHWGIAASSGLKPPKTAAEARELYAAEFWTKWRCGEFPDGVDFLLFDAAVNQTSIATKMLQQALGVTADGVIGPQTLGAATRSPRIPLIAEYSARRGAAYGVNPQFKPFTSGGKQHSGYGLGWMRRNQRALLWALGIET